MSALVEHRTSADEPPGDPSMPEVPGEPLDADQAAHVGAPQGRQAAPRLSPAELRLDFGAHLETHYPRLVAQLYAITLDPAEAHDVVQDAYSRAWRDWAHIGGSPDPAGWIRRVAVRSTERSWRRLLGGLGLRRPRPIPDGADERTRALLSALARLPVAERRCAVLHHMAGLTLAEIAVFEDIAPGTVHARLSRARHVVIEGMADVLPAVLGLSTGDPHQQLPEHSGGFDDLGRYDTGGYPGVGYDAGPYQASPYGDEEIHR